MDSDAALRLALSLSGAGFFLLVLEVWLANYACGIIGLMTIVGAIVLAFFHCSIDVAATLFLVATTFISLGVLLMLVYLPQTPLAQILFRHYAERARLEAEAEAAAAAQAEGEDDDLYHGQLLAAEAPPPEKKPSPHLPPAPLEEELEQKHKAPTSAE